MTRTKKTIIIVSCLLFALLIGGGYVYLRLVLPYEWEHLMVFEAKSPSDTGKALFVTEGFVDRGVVLYIVETETPTPRIAQIDHLDLDSRRWFHDAVWSNDGTIIGIRCRVLDGSSDPILTHAHDFQEKRSVVPIRSATPNTREYWDAHSAKIGELMSSRGGEGNCLPDIQNKSRKMDWREWRRFTRTIARNRS